MLELEKPCPLFFSPLCCAPTTAVRCACSLAWRPSPCPPPSFLPASLARSFLHFPLPLQKYILNTISSPPKKPIIRTIQRQIQPTSLLQGPSRSYTRLEKIPRRRKIILTIQARLTLSCRRLYPACPPRYASSTTPCLRCVHRRAPGWAPAPHQPRCLRPLSPSCYVASWSRLLASDCNR